MNKMVLGAGGTGVGVVVYLGLVFLTCRVVRNWVRWRHACRIQSVARWLCLSAACAEAIAYTKHAHGEDGSVPDGALPVTIEVVATTAWVCIRGSLRKVSRRTVDVFVTHPVAGHPPMSEISREDWTSSCGRLSVNHRCKYRWSGDWPRSGGRHGW